MIDDLRGFIEQVEKTGEYRVIENADWDLEIGSITEVVLSMNNPPMLLFDSIKGYPEGYRIVTGAFATPKRVLMALNAETSEANLVNYFRTRLKNGIAPIPPVEVKDGPVKENVLTGNEVDLLSFPAPKWHLLDGGRYIGTGDVVVTRDPDEGWVNLGTFRVQVQDKTTATIYISPGKHTDAIRRKYWTKGKGCPAAVICSPEPAVYFSGAIHCPWKSSEYDYAGGLKRKSIEVVRGVTLDLPIPATAELVLEGEMMPPEVESRQEGPFGEWTGYYASGSRSESAFRVKAILHRSNPIILGCPPLMNFGSAYAVSAAQNLAILWNELDNVVPGVKRVSALEGARGLYMPVISIKQMYPGHAKQTALTAVSGRTLGYHYGRFVIIVDDDIDPANPSEVLWAMATRCDPLTSIDVVRGCWSTPLDPTIPPERKALGDLTNNRAIVLACKPYYWIDKFPPSFKLSAEEVKKVKMKWPFLFKP